MSADSGNTCPRSEQVNAYALQALPPSEAAEIETHIAGCAECAREREALRPVIDSLVAWPTDVLRPTRSLWERLAKRVAADTGRRPLPKPAGEWSEPQWKEVAPGIFCKLLANDTENERVSMLVRLAPGVDYPPHRHAGVEELHLLDGVLIVDERTLQPGDYIRAPAGTADARVYSETGCTCVLITSTRDELR